MAIPVRAAAWFVYIARVVLGPPARKNILDNDPRPGEMSEAKYNRIFCEYIAAIQGLTAAERDKLIDLLWFARTPWWLLASIAGRTLTARQVADRALTLGALEKLTRQWSAYHSAAHSARPVLAAAAERVS